MSDYRISKSKVERTECPYCDQYMGLSQNLRRHITDKHPGKPFKRKGESNIDNFFSKQRKSSEDISSGSSSRPPSSQLEERPEEFGADDDDDDDDLENFKTV